MSEFCRIQLLGVSSSSDWMWYKEVDPYIVGLALVVESAPKAHASL
jgi:hypothetical protein